MGTVINVSALGVELSAETWTMHFGREKLVDIPLKAVAVMFGPVDLGPATVEGDLLHDLLPEPASSAQRHRFNLSAGETCRPTEGGLVFRRDSGLMAPSTTEKQ